MIVMEGKHTLRNVAIVQDEINELFGWKIEAELVEREHPDFDLSEAKKMGTILAYLFDDRVDDLFVSADAHSERLSHMIQDTNVIRNFEEKFDTLGYIDPKYVGSHQYLNGEQHKVVGIAGRVLLIEYFKSNQEMEVDDGELVDIIKGFTKELGWMHSIDFIIIDKYFFNEIPGKKDESYKEILSKCGFVKTGKDSYIIKINNEKHSIKKRLISF